MHIAPYSLMNCDKDSYGLEDIWGPVQAEFSGGVDYGIFRSTILVKGIKIKITILDHRYVELIGRKPKLSKMSTPTQRCGNHNLQPLRPMPCYKTRKV